MGKVSIKIFGVGFPKTLSASVETDRTVGDATIVTSATGRTTNASVVIVQTTGDAINVIRMFLKALSASAAIVNDSHSSIWLKFFYFPYIISLNKINLRRFDQ